MLGVFVRALLGFEQRRARLLGVRGRPWRDGTQAIRFEPSEFLERLALIVPRPSVLRSSPATEDGRVNLLLYHGLC